MKLVFEAETAQKALCVEGRPLVNRAMDITGVGKNEPLAEVHFKKRVDRFHVFRIAGAEYAEGRAAGLVFLRKSSLYEKTPEGATITIEFKEGGKDEAQS